MSPGPQMDPFRGEHYYLTLLCVYVRYLVRRTTQYTNIEEMYNIKIEPQNRITTLKY